MSETFTPHNAHFMLARFRAARTPCLWVTQCALRFRQPAFSLRSRWSCWSLRAMRGQPLPTQRLEPWRTLKSVLSRASCLPYGPVNPTTIIALDVGKSTLFYKECQISLYVFPAGPDPCRSRAQRDLMPTPKGLNVMKGYWNLSQQTDAPNTPGAGFKVKPAPGVS